MSLKASSTQAVRVDSDLDARQTIFKRLSETLRSSLPVSSNTNARPPLPRVNYRTANSYKYVKPKARSNLGSYYSTRRNDSNYSVQSLHEGRSIKKPIRSTYNNKYGKQTGMGGRGEQAPDIKDVYPETESGMKDCHLSNVLRSARRGLFELRQAKEHLSDLIAQDAQLSRGIRKVNPTEDHLQIAQAALTITNLNREAFVPAHRLNQVAISLHYAEDFLRYPHDIRTFQNTTGRIKLPDITFNKLTVMKIRQVVDQATVACNTFKGRGRVGEELRRILVGILRGYQDFQAVTLGCQKIFEVLLYTGPKSKAHLQQFLLALTQSDRSDLLVEIQDLRRMLDEIVIFLEKLSWGSFVIYRLASGEENPNEISQSKELQLSDEISVNPTYPAYPFLMLRGSKLTKKNLTEDSIEVCAGSKLSMKPEIPPSSDWCQNQNVRKSKK